MKATRTSALAHFQTLPLKDATRLLHHAFQEIEIKPFTIHPSSFILFTMLANTLSNDPSADKRFDFQFVNPPYGYEWSKDYDAATTREPMQNNPSVCQRPGQRDIKPETLPPLLPASLSPFTFPVLANGSMSANQSGERNFRSASWMKTGSFSQRAMT